LSVGIDRLALLAFGFCTFLLFVFSVGIFTGLISPDPADTMAPARKSVGKR
jgi:hypothetical protein